MPVGTIPFADLLWAMLISTLWVAWLVLLFRVIGDIFRRRDLSGRGKTAWIVVAILLPFLGVFAYMVTQHDGMTERKIARAAAKELEEAEFLRDIRAISQVEFDAVKQKVVSQNDAMTERRIARAAAKQVEKAAFLLDFEALTRIVRPSRHQEPAIEHVHVWAGEHGFVVEQDGGRR
jgi:hypothetical protein